MFLNECPFQHWCCSSADHSIRDGSPTSPCTYWATWASSKSWVCSSPSFKTHQCLSPCPVCCIVVHLNIYLSCSTNSGMPMSLVKDLDLLKSNIISLVLVTKMSRWTGFLLDHSTKLLTSSMYTAPVLVWYTVSLQSHQRTSADGMTSCTLNVTTSNLQPVRQQRHTLSVSFFFLNKDTKRHDKKI